MENNNILQNFILILEKEFKKELDSNLLKLAKDYAFEEEIKWRYEQFHNTKYNYTTFGISVVFVKRINEDDYGFDISFTISEGASPIVTTYIARGNGSIILDKKTFELRELYYNVEKLTDLVYEYKIVAGLLVKEHFLDLLNSSVNKASDS